MHNHAHRGCLLGPDPERNFPVPPPPPPRQRPHPSDLILHPQAAQMLLRLLYLIKEIKKKRNPAKRTQRCFCSDTDRPSRSDRPRQTVPRPSIPPLSSPDGRQRNLPPSRSDRPMPWRADTVTPGCCWVQAKLPSSPGLPLPQPGCHRARAAGRELGTLCRRPLESDLTRVN